MTDTRTEDLISTAENLMTQARTLASTRFDRAGAKRAYETAEGLVDPCMEASLDDLGESLLGYAAYLSSFVDSAMTPTPPQLEQLGALIDAVADALERHRSRVVVSSIVEHAHQVKVHEPTIFVLTRHQNLDRALASLLSKTDLKSKRVTKLEEIFSAHDPEDARALVLDVDLLPALQVFTDGDPKYAPLLKLPMMAVAVKDDLNQRLDAIRAGVDVYAVAPGELAQATTRLHELIEDRSRPYQVLVIDDDASMTLFCASILRHNGMVTQAVNDPTQAFAALKDFRPDVILVDLYMPGINGLEMLALFRQHSETLFTPVILLSGDDDAEKRYDALVVGGDDYLTKPIRPRHLVAAVTHRAKRARWMRRELSATR